jgi:peptidoglycan hydrolase CwlO-like protein
MKELTELLARKEADLSHLTRQLENVSKEVDALKTTIRLLEQSRTIQPESVDSLKRHTVSVKTDNSYSATRESTVAELP